MISRKAAMWLLLVITVVVIVVDMRLPRIPQPLSYHNFANQRSFMGIPNFADAVVSNIPFAIFGVWGLVYLLRLSPEQMPMNIFVDRRERWPYLVVFFGVLLTAFGSVYYHLDPGNERLLWDRVPMTIAFMAVVAAMIAERINVRAGLWLLPVLVLIGMGSAVQWYMSELRGAGDLRFYGAVQAYAVVFLLIMMLFPPRYTRGSDLAIAAGFYILAKVLEILDHQIFSLGQIVSGHSLKHVAAALSGYWILRMLQRRRPLRGLSSGAAPSL